MTKDAKRPSAKSAPGPGDDSVDSARMSFGDHLDELRSCLIRALLGVTLGIIICLIFGREILEIICRPLLIVQHANGLQPSLQVLAPAGAFVAYLKIGFLSGLILAMPWVLYQIWRFVSSGLYTHEQRFAGSLVPASVGLFVVGVLFLYFIVLPIVLHFFIRFNRAFDAPSLTPTTFQRLLLPERENALETAPARGLLKIPTVQSDPEEPADGDTWINTTTRRLMVRMPGGVWSAPLEPGPASPTMHSEFALDYYISFVLMLALAFGIAFEMPIVVFFLAWSRLISTATMRRGRRYVLLGTVVAAAMLTPPDVISQILLAAPMYLLFELGILVAGTVERKAEDAAAG